MDAHAVALLGLFDKKIRFEVPLFQRQYVWSREQQWEPLWEDIERKFTEYLSGRKDAPVHFLGAMVLDQKFTPTTHVERRQIIDGQQRLTTLQIFLSALRDFCREQSCDELAKELEGYTFNKGMMADPEIDKFKVWPTQLDRSQFADAVGLGSREAIELKHPLVKQKYARKYDPRPRIIEAYLFFHDQIKEFFLGSDQNPPIAAEQPLAVRIEEAFQALKGALQVVAIDLAKDDDAQVIFETLNARGEPLLPADLLRNYIFLRAARLKEPHEPLYEKYWRGFDDDFWRTEVRQGRLIRPRSDLFMQHFLSSRQTTDIPIKHLYVEYRFWIEREPRPFKTVTDELSALARQREDFRRILEPKKGDAIYGLATFLEDFDVRTGYPLLLYLLDCKLSDAQWTAICPILESYVLRRAVMGWSTKAYNRIFLNLTKELRATAPTADNIRNWLAGLTGESSAWPADDKFSEAWLFSNAYSLNNAKVSHVLWRISESFRTKLNEVVSLAGPVSIEHIMPQNWIENWPLPDGKKGLRDQDLWQTPADDPLAKATRLRNTCVQTFGNLTILTQELNSTVQNSAWSVKKPALMNSSLLPINQQLNAHSQWNELTIMARGKTLLEKATKLWPRPAATGA